MTTRLALCLLLPLLCLVSFGDLTYSAKLPPSEISTLKAIAEKLNLSSNMWNFSLDPCFDWEKRRENNLTCTCDDTTNVCHVVSIILKSENLAGELPEEFSDLTQLNLIDLTRNYINGSIPPSLAKLPLTKISFIANRISGEIPKEIGSISTLKELNCQGNQLRGRIPDSLGDLSGLQKLGLSGNDLVGELPPSLGKLTNLTDLRIDGTGLSGKLPSFIGNWIPLKILLMRGTSLEGPFPSTFAELTKMEELRVTDFKGDGGFPPIENMTSLKYLSLRNCSISGPIPGYLGNFSNLRELDLSFNKFTGRIPETFKTLSGPIKNMYLTNNRLNGTIPDWVFGKDKIDLSYNYFTGPDKESCQIGEVNLVSSFQSSQSNTTSCLRKNLPCSTSATNYKLFINCGGPSLGVDGIKYERDDYSSGISTFYISTNKNWAYSSTGDFVGGKGKLKFAASNTTALKTTNRLYLSARAAASSLKYYGLCLRSGNYTVKLHFAEIIYTDDQTFASLGRRLFDVSIQGEKVLEDFNIAAEANGTGRELIRSFNATVDDTLELHFQWSGKGTNTVPIKGNYGPLISAISVTPNYKLDLDENGLSTGAIVGISVGCLLAISLVILIPCILLRRKKLKDEEPLKMQGAYFSLRQIKAATKDFHPENKIGQGGFGSVYKGVLPDGSVVAIKQLSSKSKQGNREFLNEIGMISALNHPNLVKLFGCCIEGKQLILVYQYMENNCLGRALFGPEEARFKLDWNQRCAISLGIARGLAYLHDGSNLKIVHRDIKATNILLDKYLNARISDFGLAKLGDSDKSHISTRIVGTMGYMAPEYAMRGHLTEKTDVYSYGIVLLEIVSGKSNANYKPKEDCFYLLEWAHSLKDKGELLELVDPDLGSNYSAVEAEKMLNLSLLCTNPSPTVRPTMTWVVSVMEGKTPVAAPPEVVAQTASIGRNFKPLEKISHDSESISYDNPFTDLSLSSIRSN